MGEFSSLNAISFLGLFVMIGLAWLMSSHRTRVNWVLVIKAIILQAILAGVLFQSQSWTFDRSFDSFRQVAAAVEAGELQTAAVDPILTAAGLDPFDDLKEASPSWQAVDEVLLRDGQPIMVPRFPNGFLFYGVNAFFAAVNQYVEEGSMFVFRANGIPAGNPTDPRVLIGTFAFGVLPTVIFFASLMSILYYLGVMQFVIRIMAGIMQRTLGTSGPESMAAAANVLVGHTEAPLVIRPYVAKMTRSELNALMVGGFSTISGSLMAIFISYKISAGHLLTASIISAPAALAIAKILQPETETPVEPDAVIDDPEQAATNVIEAAAIGASEGVKLAINITGMLIAFLALLAMVNALLMGLGEAVQVLVNLTPFFAEAIDLNWSLDRLFAAVFYPLAWIMGIETGDCAIAGELLGKKVVVNEFIAYSDMGRVLNGEIVNAANETVGMSDRTKVILTYALCGFSNFGAIGIQIGGISPLAPSRRGDLAQLGLRAMFGGMLAACMTACFAGLLYGVFGS